MNAQASDVIQSLSDDQLREINFVALFDHSGSMQDDSLVMSGKSRWEELEETATSICRTMGKFDADGIDVIAFSNAVTVKTGVTVSEVKRLFTEISPGGTTNLTDALRALDQLVAKSPKRVVAAVFTDGEPNDEASVINTINDMASRYGRDKIGIVFVQVGKEARASAFLKRLDDGLKVDIVDVQQTEAPLSAGQLAWCALNG